MPASRIVFAIGDLMAEIRKLQVSSDAPPARLVLDEATFNAVIGEIENHYGEQVSRDVAPQSVGVKVEVKLGGLVISTMVGA